MQLTKHRFIPLADILPEYREEWDRVLVKCYEPRYCNRCDCVLDVTESGVCMECDDWQQVLDPPGPWDWEPEA